MVTIREFRANLKTYLERIKAGEVIEVGDISLCVHEDGLTVKEYEKALAAYSHPIDPIEPHVIESVRLELYKRCDKCKELKECRKWTEEGTDYKICAVCALKAKLPWHKLEVL